MHQFRIGLSRKVVGVVAAGVVAATAVTAASAGPPSINGCVNKSSGALRILLPNSPACGPAEEALTWNLQGIQGPPGAPGVSGMVAAFGATPDSSSSFQELTVMCPAGKVAISGGGEAVTGPNDWAQVAIQKLEPVYNGAARPTGWSLRMVQLASFNTPWHAQLYVNCAYVGS